MVAVMTARRFTPEVLVVVAAAALSLGAGCTTVIKPTRPSEAAVSLGRVAGVRFDGEQVIIREPGMPVSPGRGWQREVANYTAKELNTLVDAQDEAPVARTSVTFDLASPSVLQIGPWKEMTILLTTTLPDG